MGGGLPCLSTQGGEEGEGLPCLNPPPPPKKKKTQKNHLHKERTKVRWRQGKKKSIQGGELGGGLPCLCTQGQEVGGNNPAYVYWEKKWMQDYLVSEEGHEVLCAALGVL